jgi:flagellar biosynthesis component FlhA
MLPRRSTQKMTRGFDAKVALIIAVLSATAAAVVASRVRQSRSLAQAV